MNNDITATVVDTTKTGKATVTTVEITGEDAATTAGEWFAGQVCKAIGDGYRYDRKAATTYSTTYRHRRSGATRTITAEPTPVADAA